MGMTHVSELVVTRFRNARFREVLDLVRLPLVGKVMQMVKRCSDGLEDIQHRWSNRSKHSREPPSFHQSCSNPTIMLPHIQSMVASHPSGSILMAADREHSLIVNSVEDRPKCIR